MFGFQGSSVLSEILAKKDLRDQEEQESLPKFKPNPSYQSLKSNPPLAYPQISGKDLNTDMSVEDINR